MDRGVAFVLVVSGNRFGPKDFCTDGQRVGQVVLGAPGMSFILQTQMLVENVLSQAKLKPKDIDGVVLIGGSTRIPAVQAMLKKMFGQDPIKSINPDEAVGIAALLVLRDITEIARAAAMKAEFVANASHELRTPLATLRAAVDSLLHTQGEEPENISRILPILDRHVARLEEMTNDLLDLNIIETAKQQLRTEKIELASLVAWAEEHFAQAAGDKNVELKISTTQPFSMFASDRRLIQLILQNLIDNAIKFTPAAGRVECRLRVEDNHLGIEVSDTGCGIPAEMTERVFERFFQIDAARTGDTKVRGTGLGLAIVKHATERLGGKVMLDSTPGKGTTVIVEIPGMSD